MSSAPEPGREGTEARAVVGGVPTWYAEYGSGEPLVYLHDGFSDSRELEPVLDAYAARFRVFTPDRRGHGRTPDVAGPITYELMARDMIAFLETVVGGPADLVGYADGGTTALHVALERPDLVRRLVTISGQYHYSGLLPGMFTDVESSTAEIVGTSLLKSYAEVSPDGAEHFPVVVEKLVRMAMTLPVLDVAQLATVGARTLVACGDDDVVALEHTISMYRALPLAELAVVPGTSHVLIAEKPDLVARLVLDFLTHEPVPTFAPIRRVN